MTGILKFKYVNSVHDVTFKSHGVNQARQGLRLGSGT